jgi:hypothetical protein
MESLSHLVAVVASLTVIGVLGIGALLGLGLRKLLGKGGKAWPWALGGVLVGLAALAAIVIPIYGGSGGYSSASPEPPPALLGPAAPSPAAWTAAPARTSEDASLTATGFGDAASPAITAADGLDGDPASEAVGADAAADTADADAFDPDATDAEGWAAPDREPVAPTPRRPRRGGLTGGL